MESRIPYFVIGLLIVIICVLLAIIFRLKFLLKRRHGVKKKESTESMAMREELLDEPEEEISKENLKWQSFRSDNIHGSSDFGSSSLRFRSNTMNTESTKKEVESSSDSNTKNQKEEIIYARAQACIQEKIDREDEKEMQEELTDLHSSSDFRNISSYDCLQEDIYELYKSMEILIQRPGFGQHIKPDLRKFKDIHKQLDFRKKDLMMTDCAIVVAGETGSGKSTIINLILGEDILPSHIKATTTRVCRIRYSEKRKVSTLDKDGKVLTMSEFKDEEDMSEMLEDIANTYDHRIEYIDICFPVPLLKGNIIIVDTPGKGDSGQDDVASKMIDYLPNAVAFIFVVSVASAGGFQDDRLSHIIKHVRQSMSQMYSFDPQDAIFLLNKWDSIIPTKKRRKKDLYEELRETVHEMWEDVKDTNILKFAAAKVYEEEAYTAEFELFYQILKDVITKNEFKRVIVHLRYIESFVDACDISLSSKLKCARQNTDDTNKYLDQLCRDLQVIEAKRTEANSNLHYRIETFLIETAEDLYQYIQSKDLESIVLQGTEKYTRFTIGRELD
ncbi:dynamin-like protein 2, partial [Saccostrea cucullata]|uniref:dynamin-like protein 2 n=1 Tax=Saccostrea cuccullata TaxID=36930 RepID=UPI002ED0F51D